MSGSDQQDHHGLADTFTKSTDQEVRASIRIQSNQHGFPSPRVWHVGDIFYKNNGKVVDIELRIDEVGMGYVNSVVRGNYIIC